MLCISSHSSIFCICFLFFACCKQKLIAYDHLEGDPGLDGGKNSAPFTDILNMVCSCVDNSSPDRYVPLFRNILEIGYQFLKANYFMQHCTSSAEGSSYSCCFRKV